MYTLKLLLPFMHDPWKMQLQVLPCAYTVQTDAHTPTYVVTGSISKYLEKNRIKTFMVDKLELHIIKSRIYVAHRQKC